MAQQRRFQLCSGSRGGVLANVTLCALSFLERYDGCACRPGDGDIRPDSALDADTLGKGQDWAVQ